MITAKVLDVIVNNHILIQSISLKITDPVNNKLS